MLPDPKVKCPYTGFQKSCRSIVSADDCVCPKYVNILGKDPQTNAQISHWGCVDSIMHHLMIENTTKQMQTGAAVESFRNEVVTMNRYILPQSPQLRKHDEPQLLEITSG